MCDADSIAASSAAGKCAEWKEAVLEVEEVVEVVDGRRGRELVAVVVVVGAEEWAKAGGPEEGGLTRSGRVLGPEDLKDIVCVWCAASAVVIRRLAGRRKRLPFDDEEAIVENLTGLPRVKRTIAAKKVSRSASSFL